MAGLDSLPDAPTIARIVMAATGESPSDLRIVGQGVTAIGWRADTDGGSYCVLVGLPPNPDGHNAKPQFNARFALLSALHEREPRCPRPVTTSDAPDTPPALQGRVPWMVTEWVEGSPIQVMTDQTARDVGEVLSALHAIPTRGHGLLADVTDEVRGESAEPGTDFTSRWGSTFWPFDGRPLTAHPLVQAAPHLVLPAAALREQLLAYETQGERRVCHTDLSPAHLIEHDGRLAGVIDFGDAAVLPPAMDIASFASSYGWTATEALLEGYAANSVLRDIRRAEAYQLGVMLGLQRVHKHTRLKPDRERLQRAVAFLEATLPLAVRRGDA